MPFPTCPAARARALEGATATGDRQAVTIYTEAFEAGVVDATAEGQPHAVEVTIIRPGISANGLRYAPAVLERAAPMFEGAAAMADHPDALDVTRAGGRSIRDVVGVYHAPKYVPGHGIKATLSFLPAGEWAFSLVKSLVEARAAGRPIPPIGISADLLVVKRPLGLPAAPAAGWGSALGAGGSLDSPPTPDAALRPLAQGAVPPIASSNEAGQKARGRRALYEVVSIEAVNSADLVFRPAAGGSFDRVVEGIQDAAGDEPNAATSALPAVSSPALAAELEAAREARRQICAEVLSARLATSGLPDVAVVQLRERFAGRAFEACELDAAIAKMRELVAGLAPSPIRGAGAARVQLGLSPREQVVIALERLFGLPVEERFAHVPKLSGIREAYLLLTGDYDFSGQANPERAVAREAGETTTAAMDSVVANVMNKRLVHDYAAYPKWWAPFVTIADLRDTKTQTRLKLNDFGTLATVGELGPYLNVAWGDTEETYTVSKRGNLVYVSLEAIINDDTRAFTRLPRKLAAAAVVTVNEFVAGLFTGNPSLSDLTPVFHASRGNLGSAALDATTLAAGITAMRKVTNTAGKRLGLYPRYLLVPPDLEFAAFVLVNSTLLPGSQNNDVNALKGIVTPITVPDFTDANNWYLVADPATAESIEIGFLNGREAPELLVQDDPRSGYNFSHDAITWKVRWIFGGGWLDARSAYGAIVA